ncbi:liver-expressed antimicrobial peptide 2-like [Arapaima gigas]
MRVLTWSLLLLVLVHQVITVPVAQAEEQPGVPRGTVLLKRFARMSPLWRVVGSKPHGAYCSNDYECSTGLCRRSHCSFSHPSKF